MSVPLFLVFSSGIKARSENYGSFGRRRSPVAGTSAGRTTRFYDRTNDGRGDLR